MKAVALALAASLVTLTAANAQSSIKPAESTQSTPSQTAPATSSHAAGQDAQTGAPEPGTTTKGHAKSGHHAKKANKKTDKMKQ